jgi:hypothetical protein
MRPVLLVSCLVAAAASALLGCSNCGEGKPTPTKAARQAAPNATEGAPQPPPAPPEGQPLGGDVFKPHVPDSVAGYAAVAPGEASSSPLANGGVLTRFSRSYKRGEQTLRIEVTDSLHAPLLARVIRQQQGTERKGDTSELIGSPVGGQPAVLMYQAAAQTAYANVLVGERILLNVHVVPADGIESAVEVASALPLAALAAVLPSAAKAGAAEPTAGPGATAPAETQAEKRAEPSAEPTAPAPTAVPSPR